MRGTLLAQFPNASGTLHVGSHLIDTDRGRVYAQFDEAVPTTSATPASPAAPSTTTAGTTAAPKIPLLQVLDYDNLAVYEKLILAENLSGKSVMAADGATMYSVSDSGVTVFPIGSLDRARRVTATQEDIVFRGNFCDRRVANQELNIVNPGGASVPFTVSTTMAGVTLSPVSGVTPATISVRVDPTAFQNQKGTASGTIVIQSSVAVNVINPVRVLVNMHEPDQRGTFVNVPGKLIDMLPDPVRDRFYVLRQDMNQVLVFDGSNYSQIASLKTGNTPMQMAITFDRRYLLVGNDNSQIVNVYDLETLQPSDPIRMPYGHYPRSVAASGRQFWPRTASRDQSTKSIALISGHARRQNCRRSEFGKTTSTPG